MRGLMALALLACQGGLGELSEEEFWESYPPAVCSWAAACMSEDVPDRETCVASEEGGWQRLVESGNIVCYSSDFAAACIADLGSPTEGCTVEDYPESCDSVYQSFVEVNNDLVEPRCELEDE